MGLGGISVHQEQHVSPWSFQEILAKQQASSTGGTRSPDRQAGLSPPSGLDGQCTPGEYPDLSSIPHTGSPSPTLPPLRAPPPPPRYHLAVLGAGGSAQAWQAWHRKGSDPTPPSSLPSSCRSPSKPTIWQVWPTPTPVRSSRHGLSFTEALPFLGLGAAREAGRWVFSPATVPNAAGFSTPSPPTASGRAWSLPRQGPGKSWQERVGGLLFVSIPRPSLSETQNSNHHT